MLCKGLAIVYCLKYTRKTMIPTKTLNPTKWVQTLTDSLWTVKRDKSAFLYEV
jgi:hypothetical protein